MGWLGKQVAYFAQPQRLKISIDLVQRQSLPTGLHIGHRTARHANTLGKIGLRHFKLIPTRRNTSAQRVINCILQHAPPKRDIRKNVKLGYVCNANTISYFMFAMLAIHHLPCHMVAVDSQRAASGILTMGAYRHGKEYGFGFQARIGHWPHAVSAVRWQLAKA